MWKRLILKVIIFHKKYYFAGLKDGIKLKEELK